ncbi:PAS domain S-box-containing protein/putative nucleotidyltransferase with HDIG domain [Thioalbus denitrificans]|uniref:PAS domain S-box-containing protein/putative nucleotidyltransferase with HDIG domain n=1 Tax=Thioalbus denitrificans TaxID=547122 RepID=A0A369CJT1_9GAMM|nr:PAS domain S-box-containing protein/putative nucleotidyltransferase with HDIG domain [Thioalbus denitrificans]
MGIEALSNGPRGNLLEDLEQTLAVCSRPMEGMVATLEAVERLPAALGAVCLVDADGALVVRLSFGMEGASDKVLAPHLPGELAAARALRSGRLVHVPDYSSRTDCRRSDLEAHLGVMAAAYAPLAGGGGILLAVPPAGEGFDGPALTLLQGMAAHLGAALGRFGSRPAAEAPGVDEPPAGLAAALESIADTPGIDALCDRVLENSLYFTDSEFGFVGYLDPETGFLTAPTMTRDIFAQCGVEGKTLVFEKPGGLGGHVLASGVPLIANDPFSHPASVGTPPGHLPIRRFLGVPCRYGGRVVGMIALANKERDYTIADQEIVGMLGVVFATAVTRNFSQAALEASRNKYRALYDQAPCGYHTLLPDGRIQEANATLSGLLGRSHGAFVGGMNLNDLVVPEDRAVLEEQVRRVQAAGSAPPRQLRLLAADGTARTVMHSLRGHFDDRGYLLHIHGMALDVTNEARVEQELHKTRDYLEALFRHASAPILVWDAGRRLTRVNKGFRDLTGYTDDECLGQPLERFFPASLRAAQLERIRRAMAGEDLRGEGLTLVSRAGAEHSVLWNSANIGEPGGAERATIAQGLDITEHEQGARRLYTALEETIRLVAATVEKRDPYTAGHQQRVAQLAVAMARQMGLPEKQVDGIRLGGLVHDIGKVALPAELLSRPGRLTELEFELIREHSELGYEILRDADLPWPVARMVREHHERLDGSGYPLGLVGEAILPEARILAVADVVEAMSSDRPYRPGQGIDVALAHLEEMRGRWFDARAVDVCLALFRDRGFRFDTGDETGAGPDGKGARPDRPAGGLPLDLA